MRASGGRIIIIIINCHHQAIVWQRLVHSHVANYLNTEWNVTECAPLLLLRRGHCLDHQQQQQHHHQHHQYH